MPKLSKLLSSLTIFFPLILYTTFGATSVSAQTVPNTLKTLDPRVLVLKYYLEGYQAPFQDEAEKFISEADKNGFDWKLLPAISAVESRFGHRFPANSYNAWGYGIHSGKGFFFNSWDSAIGYISQDIKQKYVNQGLITPYAMNTHYSTNPDWGWQVDYYMQELDQYSKDFLNKFGPQISNYNQQVQATQAAELVTGPIFQNQTALKVNSSSLSLVIN